MRIIALGFGQPHAVDASSKQLATVTPATKQSAHQHQLAEPHQAAP